MNKKAVKIDLSTFFDDERKMTYVLVDPNWKSVACLQKRVEFLFDVDSVRFISDGYFLPPQEPIEIINYCNELKGFVPKESLKKRNKKKPKKCKKIEKSSEDSDIVEVNTIENGVEQPIDELQRKRKFNILEGKPSSSFLLNQAKRSKNCNSSEITSTSEQIPPAIPVLVDEVKSKKPNSKKSKILTVTSDYEDPMLQKQSFRYDFENVITENSSTLKENNLVSRCSDSQPQTSTPKDVSEISKMTVEKSFTDETDEMLEQRHNANRAANSHNPSNPFKKPNTSKAHIHFNESGEVISPTNKSNKKSIPKDKEPKIIVIFRCPLNDVTNGAKPQKPRIFHLEPKGIENNKTKKQIVEIKEHIVILSNNLPQNLAKDTSVMNESEIKQPTAKLTDASPEKGSLNNISIATESTAIAKNDNNALEKSANQDLEVTHNEDTNVTHTHNDSKMQKPTNGNETSIMSVDCVDLSLDVDELLEEEVQKKKTRQTKLKTNAQEKHDLTTDDYDDNDSSSDVEEISEIIDLNETEDNNSGGTMVNNSKAPSNNLDSIRVDQILPFSTDMTDSPNIGDIIVFKIPYVNKKKKLVHTNYMAGKAEYINRRTKSIKILIIDGATELSHVPSQFICNLDDSQDYIRHVQLKLSEMLEPKLFSIA